jgi:hypothetical protein
LDEIEQNREDHVGNARDRDAYHGINSEEGEIIQITPD